jgi:tRNA uridine 5-carboxymethylaminomethyl modification enzyme
MLTSRAEFRLHLRADNAVARLGRFAQEIGVLSPEGAVATDEHLDRKEAARAALFPHADTIARGASIDDLTVTTPTLAVLDRDIAEEVCADLAYLPYVERQQREEQARRGGDAAIGLARIPSFREIAGLSHEMVERLDRARPATLADASRVRGITPAALTAILAAVRRAA